MRRERAGGVADGAVVWGGPVSSTVWLFFLVSPIRSLFASPEPPGYVWPILGEVALFVALYLGLVLRDTYSGADPHPRHLRRDTGILTAMAALCVVTTLTAGPDWMGGLFYTSAAAGCKLPTKRALSSIALLEAVTLILATIVHSTWVNTGQAVIFVGVIGLITTGVCRMILTIRELERARREMARLAVAEERLRMARDLHDLLGHSLSLIAVKSELAKRLILAHPEQAMAEIADVEGVSRKALLDVRAAVSGYRQLSLARELESSREILAAAQIGFEVESGVDRLLPETESVLAWTVREGVTNVVRHGHARRCMVRLERTAGGIRCEVRNDRRGVRPGLAGEFWFGNGLTGLSERVQAQGGRAEATLLPDGGFLLTVTLPAEAMDQGERGIPRDSRTAG